MAITISSKIAKVELCQKNFNTHMENQIYSRRILRIVIIVRGLTILMILVCH